MQRELTITERSFAQGVILDLKGHLTKQAEEALLQWRNWEVVVPGGTLVLNMTGVELINSAGIALLIRLAGMSLKAGYAIYAYGLTAHYQKMFRLIGLTDYMMIYPDEYSLQLRLQ